MNAMQVQQPCFIVGLRFSSTYMVMVGENIIYILYLAKKHFSHSEGFLDQSSVAEWLRQWANLGLKPPLSDWEDVGSNLTAGTSRIGVFYPGKKFQCFFPDRKCL